MSMETELKLRLSSAQARRLAAHPVLSGGTPQKSRLANTYYDTPDFALRQRGIALRLRRKGWAITATKSMAIELAPKKIRVNCLCPVAGDTGMLARFMGEDTPEMREKFRASIPLGRLSQPLDIANAALFLCSPAASWVSGQVLTVSGGGVQELD